MAMVPSPPTPAHIGQAQPWNRIIWPHEAATLGASLPAGAVPYVLDAPSALRIPAVARATALYTGTIKQCPMDAYRGSQPLERPALLAAPDPDMARSWFVQVQVEDYLTHGNALHLVTARNAEGWPASVAWIPAAWTNIIWEPDRPTRYLVGGYELPAGDVVHVRRGADRSNPGRGVGIVEQHLATLDRAAMEEDYEKNILAGSGVPSVSITVPNSGASETELDNAFDKWMQKFYGPKREPVFLPYGTVVTPLGWSPEASQMVEARKLSLQDVANIYNLDGYWLGANAPGLTYRSPGPMYLALLRTSLEPVLVDLEQVWSAAWLPRGQSVVFDRLALTRDDLQTTVTTLAQAVQSGLFTPEEARTYLGLAARPIQTAPTVLSPVDTEQPEPDSVEEVPA